MKHDLKLFEDMFFIMPSPDFSNIFCVFLLRMLANIIISKNY